MLKKLFLALLAVFFISLPVLISPPQAKAETDWDNIIPGEDPGTEQVIDFCRRRQGNQMNLETWYSGKCDPKGDTFAGDQVGFSDIFILDIYERVSGEDDGTESFSDKFKNLLGFHDSIFSLSSTEQIASATQKIKSGSVINQGAVILGTILSNPPASSANYIASVKQNLNDKKIVKEAVAANEGFGFNSFAPVLPVWKAFRNMAYFFFVIIFIAMGFAIMFRVKINSQTVIGIQAILPKIIALLLIITFSYAIVGLMIDLMYVIFYLIINAFTASGIIRKAVVGGGQPIGILMASGQWGIIAAYLLHLTTTIAIAPAAVAAAVTGLPIGITAIIDILLTVTGIGIIIRLILLFAIAYTFFKLFTKLLGAYITIVVQLIFAPIILLAGVFPGSKTVGNWFRNLLANMSVFPTTMVFLLLSYVFMVQPLFTTLGPLGTITGAKDLVAGWGSQTLNAPLIFGRAPGAANIMALIGVGLLLMASKYVDMIKDALQVPPFKYGTAIGEALQFGKKTALWPVKQAANIAKPLIKTKLGIGP